MPEDICGDVIYPHARYVRTKQTSTCNFSVGDLSLVRFSEAFFPPQLALLFGHVPVSVEEPRTENVSCCTRYVSFLLLSCIYH